RRRCECAGLASQWGGGASSDQRNGLFRCGAAAKYGLDHLSFSSRRGGRVVECTALQNRGLGVRVPPLLPRNSLKSLGSRVGDFSNNRTLATLLLPFPPNVCAPNVLKAGLERRG